MTDQYHDGFIRVQRELANIRDRKVVEYGTARYEIADRRENAWMCYSDVYRKFIRLREQIRNDDDAGLRETYLDIANYATMAVQMLDKLEDGT
jgi:hypothetical protein